MQRHTRKNQQKVKTRKVVAMNEDIAADLLARTKKAKQYIMRRELDELNVEYHDVESHNPNTQERCGWRGVDLSRMTILDADFSGAFLQSVNFSETNLAYANFGLYDIDDAEVELNIVRQINILTQLHAARRIDDDSLENAIAQVNQNGRVDNPDLQIIIDEQKPTRLLYAKFNHATLWSANFNGALMFRAVLDGADLDNADMSHADLRQASFVSAFMSQVKMTKANLHEANLENANLDRANLKKAYLAGANLKNANLERASLLGTDLRRAKLKGANFKDASFFPDGYDLTESSLKRYLNCYESYYLDYHSKKVDKNLRILRKVMREDLILKIKNKIHNGKGSIEAEKLLSIAFDHGLFSTHRRGNLTQKNKLTKSQKELAKAQLEIKKNLQTLAENDESGHYGAYAEWALIADVNKLNGDKVIDAFSNQREKNKLSMQNILSLKAISYALLENKNTLSFFFHSDVYIRDSTLSVNDPFYGKLYINLQHADLEDCDLSNVNLCNVDLRNAKLTHVNLSGAKFIPEGNLVEKLAGVLNRLQEHYAGSSNLTILKRAIANDIIGKINATDNEADRLALLHTTINHSFLQDIPLTGLRFFPVSDKLNEDNLLEALNLYKECYMNKRDSKKNINLKMLKQQLLEELITSIKHVYDQKGYIEADKLLKLAFDHDLFSAQSHHLTTSQKELAQVRADIHNFLQMLVEQEPNRHDAYVQWASITDVNKLDAGRIESAINNMNNALTETQVNSLMVTLFAVDHNENLLDFLRAHSESCNANDMPSSNNFYVNLQNANLAGLDLSGINFINVNLRNADLTNAILTGAKFFPDEDLLQNLPNILASYQEQYAKSNNLGILKHAIANDLIEKINNAGSDSEKKKLLKIAVDHPLFAGHRHGGSRFFNGVFSIFTHHNAIKTATQKVFASQLKDVKKALKHRP